MLTDWEYRWQDDQLQTRPKQSAHYYRGGWIYGDWRECGHVQPSDRKVIAEVLLASLTQPLQEYRVYGSVDLRQDTQGFARVYKAASLEEAKQKHYQFLTTLAKNNRGSVKSVYIGTATPVLASLIPQPEILS